MPSNRSSRRPSKHIGESGNALLIVIGAVAIIAAIGVVFLATAGSQSKVIAAQTLQIRASAAADNVATLARWRLLRDWSDGPILETSQPCTIDGFQISVSVSPESDRLNVNLAPKEALAGEFESAGISPGRADALARAIADFRSGGARKGAPARAGFDIIDELLLVPGVTAQDYAAIEPRLSTLSNRATGTQLPGTTLARDTLFRISASVFSGGDQVFRRVAVIEVDPLRSAVGAVRLWRLDRTPDQNGPNLAGQGGAPTCEEALSR